MVETASWLLMVRGSVTELVACVGLVESVTVRVTEAVPLAVGVPLMTPAGLMESPAGKPDAVNV